MYFADFSWTKTHHDRQFSEKLQKLFGDFRPLSETNRSPQQETEKQIKDIISMLERHATAQAAVDKYKNVCIELYCYLI